MSAEISAELESGIKKALDGVSVSLQIRGPKPAEVVQTTKNLAPSVKNFIMVSSGKGGVGKSTTTVNLAIALAQMGKKVGVMDADIYGPNIHRMFGIEDVKPEVDGNKIKPTLAYGVDVMSMGMLLEPGQALIWRGAMIMKMVNQLLTDVAWGELDVLVIDMPPGTGDAQLTLAQSVPVTCGVVVTTPQTVAIDDAKRSMDMFVKLNIPIGGVIENMSGFICPDTNKEYDIFGKGAGYDLAKSYGVEVLAEIPIEIATREGGDAGRPVTFFNPTSETAKRFRIAAENLWKKIELCSDKVDNACIQPTKGLDGVSACSSAPKVESHSHSDDGCGCGH
jgi:ATP-binding protein involved in chromosome partitioning